MRSGTLDWPPLSSESRFRLCGSGSGICAIAAGEARLMDKSSTQAPPMVTLAGSLTPGWRAAAPQVYNFPPPKKRSKNSKKIRVVLKPDRSKQSRTRLENKKF